MSTEGNTRLLRARLSTEGDTRLLRASVKTHAQNISFNGGTKLLKVVRQFIPSVSLKLSVHVSTEGETHAQNISFDGEQNC